MQQLKLSFLYSWLFILSCSEKEKIYMPDSTYNSIVRACPSKTGNDRLVYHFDGDCSKCIVDMLNLEREYGENKEINIVFVAKTQNPLIFRANMRDKGISSCIIIDSTMHYDNLLPFDQQMRVSSNKEITILKTD